MSILDFLFPKKCVGCGKWGKYLCDRCFRQLKWLHPKVKLVGGGMDGLVSWVEYEGVARRAIVMLKFKFVSDLIEEVVGKILGERQDMREKFRGFTVVPVPLAQARERWRGFNQAAEIGRLVASRWSLALSDLLVRVKNTGQQVGKSRKERLENVRGAFGLKTRDQLPRAVLLVDDVWTSGATMRAAASVLKRAGVKTVWGLALARRVGRNSY